MRISFDHKHDIMRIKFQDGKYDVSKEVSDGVVIDMTKDNKMMAIEILDVSQKIPLKDIKEVTVGVSG
ncbi:MAG TPA: DUF2283 domain-containing protein [Candidatus Nanoarchaeia archaeon]|nr:DUF2283 domain-containing protein [Candidatus Nanoarchaeia archaeon]